MSDNHHVVQAVQFGVILAVFLSGLCAVLMRRMAAWSLAAQLTALKAVAAGAFLLARSSYAGARDFWVLSIVVLGLIPLVAAVGVLVIHRCSRFGGKLDLDEESRLRN